MAGLTLSDVTSTYIGNGKKTRESVSKVETKYISVTFDASYPTNGEALDLRTYSKDKATEPFYINQSVHNLVSAGYRVAYDSSAHKLVVYASGATEAANESDLHTLVVLLECKYLYK